MAYYAFLDQNNIVTEVIKGIDETELIEGVNPENWYGNFRGQTCKRTSFNSNIRGKFAGVGDTYDADEDAFIAPKPYSSWVRSGYSWVAPIAHPENVGICKWNEATLSWDKI